MCSHAYIILCKKLYIPELYTCIYSFIYNRHIHIIDILSTILYFLCKSKYYMLQAYTNINNYKTQRIYITITIDTV